MHWRLAGTDHDDAVVSSALELAAKEVEWMSARDKPIGVNDQPLSRGRRARVVSVRVCAILGLIERNLVTGERL